MNLRRKFFSVILGASLMSFAYGCSPSYPDCYSDEDCADKGEYCLNAKCAQCRTDEHCTSKNDESYYCGNGSCLRINGYCNPETGFQCPAGQKCRDRRCGPECYPETAAQDCGPDQICENNRCKAKPECVSDQDCLDGKVCVNNRCVEPEKCVLKNAYFDFDESAIRSDAKVILDENVKCLNNRKDISTVRVTGHCDERGTEEYNMGLGKRRADAVRNVVSRAKGKNVSSKSRGAYEPVVPNATTEAQHQQNRRVEFDMN